MKRKPDPFDKYAEQLLEDMKKSGREIKSSGEAEDIMAHMLGRLLTKMLDGEMTNHLGYGKGEARLGDNERNGHSSKTMKSPKVGSVKVDVPRDRKGRFQPGIIPKHKRNLEGFDEKILALYARGMTVREIQGFLYDEYGMETSAEFISDVTDAILPELEKWQNRPLSPVYPVIFFDAIRIKIRGENGIVTPRAVHIALGVDTDGKKDVLGMWIAENESAKYWLTVFNELKNRGVTDILIAVTDGLKGMKEALEAAFPKTLLQTCIIHLIRNSLKMVSYKDYKAVTAALKPIYRAVNAEQARQALDDFSSSDLGKKYPYIAKQWLDARDRVIPFFDFSPNVRRLIYTTNAIESLNRDLRKAAKTRASFPTEAAAMKLLYLAVRKVEKRWLRPSPYWKAAMTELAIEFGDRLTPCLD
ncbi:MAG: Mutator family transposase [Burkholderia sp.]|jgi:putative transposase